MRPSVIYLDANSTTPPDLRVWDRMRQTAEFAYANPGSSHQRGRQARQALEDSRETIARILGGQPQELIFTSGATESTHLALMGLAAAVPPGKHKLAISAGEHPATVETAEQLRRQNWEILSLPLDQRGLIPAEFWPSLPWSQLGLISVLYANNETGVIQDLAPLRKWCAEQAVPWHVDLVQAVGRIPVSFTELGATAATFCVHKCHGPRGIGGLFLRAGVPFVPVMGGGFQEMSRRPGTEPVALAAGMAETLRLWAEEADVIQSQLQQLRDQLETLLQEQAAPLVINGLAAPRLPNTSNITFPGVEAEALLIALDLEGICCSLGSACASGSVEPSPVLLAMGIDPLSARSSLRFSLHRQHTREEITTAAHRIATTVNRLRQLTPS